MTTTSESLPHMSGEGRELRRNRTILWVLGAIIVLAIAAPLAVWSLSASAFNGVRLYYDADPLTCEGTETGLWPDSFFTGHGVDEQYNHALSVTPGMECSLQVNVVNDGRRPVEVTAVGAVAGAGALELVQVSPNGVGPSGEGGDGEPPHRIEGLAPLEAGARQAFTLNFTTDRPIEESERCTVYGGYLPRLTVSAWGRTRVFEPPQEQYIALVMGGLQECSEY